jgi:hypothetical protein
LADNGINQTKEVLDAI